MGFIAENNTIQIKTYLTQLGRKYILDGNKEDFQIEFFTLHDDDINYQISSNIVDGFYNTTPSGFIPDLTGDDDTCIKSVAYGVEPNPDSYLTGSTISVNGLFSVGEIGTDGQINSRKVELGFNTNTTSVSRNQANASSVYSTVNIPITINSSNLTTAEKTNLKLKASVKIIDSQGIEVLVNDSVNSSIIDFTNLTTNTINIPVKYRFNSAKITPSDITYNIELTIKTYKSFANLVDSKHTISIVRSGFINPNNQNNNPTNNSSN